MNLIKKRQPKDMMTHRQYEIYKRTSKNTAQSNNWLRKQGLDECTFTDVHIRLLEAQRQAHTLLKKHRMLLSSYQIIVLEKYLQLVTHKRTRNKLKPQAANPVLNISTKINRQLFKQYRQLTQT
jgi:hypothetical protein